MSVAGGWFSLMVCEMFVLGNRDRRLPGLGSYLQKPHPTPETCLRFCGDYSPWSRSLSSWIRLSWRLIIAWSEKFKFEQVEAADEARSPVLDFIRRSRMLSRVSQSTVAPAREAITLFFARRRTSVALSAIAAPTSRASCRSPCRSSFLPQYRLRYRALKHDARQDLSSGDVPNPTGSRRYGCSRRVCLAFGGVMDHSRRRIHRTAGQGFS